jgi:hypothetical protein
MSNEPTPRTDDFLSRNSSYMEKRVYMIELERELTEVTKQRDALAEALQSIKNELGVPQPEYPAPVANAVKIANKALQSLTPNEL